MNEICANETNTDSESKSCREININNLTNIGHSSKISIINEFGNIVNNVSEEEFRTTMGNFKRIRWSLMLEVLKDKILDSTIQDWNKMWEEENLIDKLKTLEKQVEKCSILSREEKAWRPQLGDVNSQLRTYDIIELKKQKEALEKKTKEYEDRVLKLRETLLKKRAFLRVLQFDIHKYKKKNNLLVESINEQLTYDMAGNDILKAFIRSEDLTKKDNKNCLQNCT